ncbi:guanine-N2--methyltransferase [Ephemerocybe angulata]|uniref:tRNA (guanine(26)-N(2))-dimethyltransferase n=1 Tax=Ephemerocybe angulata TaxID=980116 RepID=A0A8H6IHV4_9AGAR|nr:guanine-N2--methyltransferase [Tulosesus angulatus]
MVNTAPSTKEVPEGYVLHTENSSSILLDANAAFLNPVQEFNRDLSVACIRVWSEESNRTKEAKWRQKQDRKQKAKVSGKDFAPATKRAKANHPDPTHGDAGASTSEQASSDTASHQPYRFTILEALSATGLRSIRYAKEIPLLKHVIANDLSPAAVEAMHRNVEWNDLGEKRLEGPDGQTKVIPAKVRVNEGDACSLMYSHREEKDRVDVVDLDPYGTAAPFIDPAIQSIKDGGLLCVTCTDLAVLATNNYPEKCFSNYGGVPVKAEFAHEVALRLLLHTLATSAARYGRYITPLVSLSIDFYIRVFVRVDTGPAEVKKVQAKTSLVHVCSSCQSFYNQPLGRVVEKKHEKSGHTNYLYKTQTNVTPEKCEECEGNLHVAGPMWNGPLHDPEYIGKVLEHLESNVDHYGTATRMKGMLTELDTLFYFVPGKVSGHFHCQTPALEEVASALLNAGFKISRSHACAGSLKTTASNRDIHDVIRGFIKLNPVKTDKIPPSSPALRLLAKEPKLIADFTRHPDSAVLSKVRLVRYQENPTPHWGPGARATGKANPKLKRKREEDAEGMAVDGAPADDSKKPE